MAMGKSTTDLPIQNVGQNLPQAYAFLSAVTPESESTSVTRRDKEVILSGQPHGADILNKAASIFNEVIVQDCDEDGGEGSDPPIGSFLRRRLDEQSQTFSRGIDKLREVISNTSETHTRLLDMLVRKVYDDKPFDHSPQLPLRNNPLLMVQTEPTIARFKQIDLEKRRGSSSRLVESEQRVETASVDMTEIQRMIDSV